ncbi:uncharacterized protein LOC135840007 [Planococcus citri]|uniref:uncharacterized protein LOC135840007 n=1 Tax=Planococcus citri TaxID=170843 RepID=UPI0031F7578D
MFEMDFLLPPVNDYSYSSERDTLFAFVLKVPLPERKPDRSEMPNKILRGFLDYFNLKGHVPPLYPTLINASVLSSWLRFEFGIGLVLEISTIDRYELSFTFEGHDYYVCIMQNRGEMRLMDDTLGRFALIPMEAIECIPNANLSGQNQDIGVYPDEARINTERLVERFYSVFFDQIIRLNDHPDLQLPPGDQ